MSLDSSFVEVTLCGVDLWELIHDKDLDIFFATTLNQLWGLSLSCPGGTTVLTVELKRSAYECDHSLHFKSVRRYRFIPHACYRVVLNQLITCW
jgi:hypothetical protein